MSNNTITQRSFIQTRMLSRQNGRDEKNCEECHNNPIYYQCLEKKCEVKICKECEKKHDISHTLLS